jgi:hypothetical protein
LSWKEYSLLAEAHGCNDLFRTFGMEIYKAIFTLFRTV